MKRLLATASRKMMHHKYSELSCREQSLPNGGTTRNRLPSGLLYYCQCFSKRTDQRALICNALKTHVKLKTALGEVDGFISPAANKYDAAGAPGLRCVIKV
ncbi:hypothetical protein EVAR_27841_1 [Eumeta japonica]|uniref:Uncharacterized protein n=1 Tax=Eumeta variegata TaxID=151549 RepID=A0A4C1VLA6_EUMVA|nr:hypothetical protein EVAR_27841_1 [Eumeta japonica]